MKTTGIHPAYENPVVPQEQRLSTLLDGALTGDVHRARILYISDKMTHLRFENGDIIRAYCEEALPVHAGDIIDVAVRLKDETGILLEMISGRAPAAQHGETPAETLVRIGLAPSVQNLQRLAMLADMGIAAEKEILLGAAEMIEAYPELGEKCALFSAANGIRPTPQNLSEMVSLFTGKTKITESLSALVRTMEDLSVIPDTTEKAVAGNVQRSALYLPSHGSSQQARSGEYTWISPGHPSHETQLQSTLAVHLLEAEALNLNVFEPDELYHNTGQFLSRLVHNIKTAGYESARIDKEVQVFVQEQYGSLPEEQTDILCRVLRQCAEDIVSREAAGSSGTKEHMPLKDAGADGRAESGEKTGTKNTPFNEKTVRNTDVIKQLTVKAEGTCTQKGMRLRQTAEQIGARLKVVEAYVEKDAQAYTAKEQARQMITSCELMTQINRFAYCQIPVRLVRDETAELYVFYNSKRGKKTDPEDVRILLGLDTQNLRRVEMMIHIKGKTVSVEFGTASEEISAYIRHHIASLHEHLREAGYKTGRTDYKTQSKPTAPMEALAAVAGGGKHRKKIDICL